MVLQKEYRITLPFTVDEYRIGQLYAVAKASQNETSGGEGVEILVNQPFEDEKGKGQYTHKIYHLGNRVPGWIRAIVPTSALQLEEKAWNAFPYCKTVLSSPFLGEKFAFVIESMHHSDKGEHENALGLDAKTRKNVKVDRIDIAVDAVDPKDYKPEEDPSKVKSEKTGRGPLEKGWQEKQDPIMTAYKLVTVEFAVFGFQTKVEDFIMKFEAGLFLKFHKQVFCWMDEWYGMTIEDVRAYEEKTKAATAEKLAKEKEGTAAGNTTTTTTTAA